LSLPQVRAAQRLPEKHPVLARKTAVIDAVERSLDQSESPATFREADEIGRIEALRLHGTALIDDLHLDAVIKLRES
jgi:hypothetical protein